MNISNEDYRIIFEHMAKGLRAGDPKLKILTASTGVVPDKWSKAIKLHKGLEDFYDVINVHKYPAAEGWPTWRRSYPEDPKIDYLKVIRDVVEWRDRNARDKEIWVTEFGYDACTDAAMKTRKKPFQRWVDVTDKHQAQWIVRSFLVFTTMDLERAYLYFFNDNDSASTHAAAGLTRKFKPKPSFHAMAHLYRSLAEYRLNRVLRRQPEGVHALEFSRDEPEKGRVWVLWHATGNGKQRAFVTPAIPGAVRRAERMPLKPGPAPTVQWRKQGRAIRLTVTESPVYLWIRK